MKTITTIIICVLISTSMSLAQEFTQAQLKEDASIFRKSLTTLHPGLYRYNDTSEMARHFDEFEKNFMAVKSTKEAYLEITKCLMKIKCGHTYANYWNQPDRVKELLFTQADKLPFTFDIINRSMIVMQNVSNNKSILPGMVVTEINDISVSDIFKTLLDYVNTDGTNDNKKWHSLTLSGLGRFEDVDIFFPLLYPPTKGKYVLTLQNPENNAMQEVTVDAISRENRKSLLKEQFNIAEDSYDDLWSFEIIDDELAILKLGTFVTYKMTINWKAFLANAFRELEKKKIPNLILDIRGNAGGDDDVNQELLKYLVKETLTTPSLKAYVRTPKTPEDLRPYVSTWDKGFYNWGSKVERSDNGLYQFKKRYVGKTIRPTNKMYQGEVYTLIDGSNSSATYYLAQSLKAGKVGTLVGQGTGGNQRGMNAGAILFATLPNTRIEFDIPLIATVFDGDLPDAGLEPDVFVEQNAKDIANQVDRELQAVLKLIEQKKSKR